MENKTLAHTRWECKYHVVFILKYSKEGTVREFAAVLVMY
jgi:REP element-mobilizing transposase RayT